MLSQATDKEPNWYSYLGIAPQDSQAEIRKAYDIMTAGIAQLLTDANPSVSLRAIEEKAEIEAAWAVLGDEDKRREYDMRLGSAKPGYPRTSLGYDEITGVPVRPLRPRNKTEVGSGEAIKNRVPRGRAWTTTETERPPGVVDGIARLDGAAKMEEVRETEEVNGEREDREGLEKTNEE